MSFVSHVLDYIKTMMPDRLFSTRELLALGPRAQLDTALARLAEKSILRRLATGIYCLASDNNKMLGAADIIMTKARAFNKRIFLSLQIDETECTNSNEYFTDGCRSSFSTPFGRLYFKPISPKKMGDLCKTKNNLETEVRSGNEATFPANSNAHEQPTQQQNYQANGADALSWLISLTEQLLEKIEKIDSVGEYVEIKNSRRKFYCACHLKKRNNTSKFYSTRTRPIKRE